MANAPKLTAAQIKAIRESAKGMLPSFLKAARSTKSKKTTPNLSYRADKKLQNARGNYNKNTKGLTPWGLGADYNSTPDNQTPRKKKK